jgi:hypothetical protein
LSSFQEEQRAGTSFEEQLFFKQQYKALGAEPHAKASKRKLYAQ